MMSPQERDARRRLIVRRQASHRMRRVQLEIWRRRRSVQGEDLDETVGQDDLLADLPEGLLG